MTVTDPLLPALPGQPVDPAVALQQAIAVCTTQGWRLQSVSNNTAVMVSGGSTTNHVLHAVLSLFTCGLWLAVWLLILLFGNDTPEKSLLIMVDEQGNVSYQPGA